MKSVLLRAGSVPVHSSLLPRATVPLRHDSFSGFEKTDFPASPKISLQVNSNRQRISRTISEPERMIRSRFNTSLSSLSFSTVVPETEEMFFSREDDDDEVGDIRSLTFAEKCLDRMNSPPLSGILVEESGIGSGSGRDGRGCGRGGSSGGSNNNNDNADRSKIKAYYQEMLKSSPTDALLLRNYGKFLHEVEGDAVKAEEYYGRAILASPGDGEVLALYGKLIWETQRDVERAQSYFDQAVNASPDDCMVMGSYAQFMWESEEEEEEEEEDGDCRNEASAFSSMVGAC